MLIAGVFCGGFGYSTSLWKGGLAAAARLPLVPVRAQSENEATSGQRRDSAMKHGEEPRSAVNRVIAKKANWNGIGRKNGTGSAQCGADVQSGGPRGGVSPISAMVRRVECFRAGRHDGACHVAHQLSSHQAAFYHRKRAHAAPSDRHHPERRTIQTSGRQLAIYPVGRFSL